MVVGVIDYGLGNIGSVINILDSIGVQAEVCDSEEKCKSVDRFILPGVGAFDNGIKNLRSKPFFKELENQILNEKKYVLGICLGMQLLLDSSDEGKEPGLSWINGRVKKFVPGPENIKVPHMGWNFVKEGNGILKLNNSTPNKFYFVHSYYAEIEDDKHIMFKSKYGSIFHSGVGKDNILGVQFHPEKSHKYGQELLRKFCSL